MRARQTWKWRRKWLSNTQAKAGQGIEYAAELDLDLETGAGHIFEAIGNHLPQLIGRDKKLTHPYAVVQALVWEWGVAAFRLEPGEMASGNDE